MSRALPFVVRAALRVWPRDAREEGLEDAVATALQAGGSVGREAAGLMRGGMSVRLARLLRGHGARVGQAGCGSGARIVNMGTKKWASGPIETA